MTSQFNIQIINSLMLYWGVRFYWFDCNVILNQENPALPQEIKKADKIGEGWYNS